MMRRHKRAHEKVRTQNTRNASRKCWTTRVFGCSSLTIKPCRRSRPVLDSSSGIPDFHEQTQNMDTSSQFVFLTDKRTLHKTVLECVNATRRGASKVTFSSGTRTYGWVKVPLCWVYVCRFTQTCILFRVDEYDRWAKPANTPFKCGNQFLSHKHVHTPFHTASWTCECRFSPKQSATYTREQFGGQESLQFFFSKHTFRNNHKFVKRFFYVWRRDFVFSPKTEEYLGKQMDR